jgi:CIC family chloride channel protein
MEWLRNLRQRLSISGNSLLLSLAIAVGLATGGAIWLFDHAIEFFHWLFREQLADHWLHGVFGAAAIIVSLSLAGLLVGWIMARFVGEERHHGVAGIMESVALSGGRLRYWRIPYKAVASALSLGAGASVGPEDPSVQIGSNIGSFFGQRLQLSDTRVRVLVAAGAASAIAAAFRAPLAGVFFALEIVLNGQFTTGSFSVVVLSAVISSAFMQSLGTPRTLITLVQYELGGIGNLALYGLLGLLLAPLCVLFIRLVYWQHDLWHHYGAKFPRPLKTALAGALVGLVAIFVPQIMGTGREFMVEVLNSGSGELAVGLLLTVGGAKLLMTPLSLAGGFVGGIFAPSLFVGTMLGGAFGRLLEQILPVDGLSNPQGFAIAGMAAMMAGVVRAPITGIMLVFELTQDFRLILAIMLTSVVCMLLADRFEPNGVYTLGLLRKGVRLKQGRDVDLMEQLQVADAMKTPAYTVHLDTPLVVLRDTLRLRRARALCVVDNAGELQGIVTLSDLQRAYEQGDASKLQVADICTREVITTTPDESLSEAMRRMGERDLWGLPVLKRGSRLPVGMVSRPGIMQIYSEAVARKVEAQHAVEQARLHHLTGAHVVEYTVQPGAMLVGKALRELVLPPSCVIASIRRGEKRIVPRGETRIMARDVLTVVVDPENEAALASLVGQHPATPN